MKHNNKSNLPSNANAIKITNEYDHSPAGYSTSIKSDFLTIKAQIVSEIKDELFTQNSDTIISNYKNILCLIQGDILNKCDKSKGTKILHDILPKKLECFLSYIIDREKSNDALKLKTIDLLSEYLTQLSDIVFNYILTQKSEEDNTQEQYYNREREDKGNFNEIFVPLINQLSKLTKGFRDDAKIINKLFNDLLTKANEKMEICKALSNEIFIQSALNNKMTVKTIQSKGICLNETVESLLSYHKEINNKMISSEKNNVSFFNNAKDIFRKLKELHNEFKGKTNKNNNNQQQQHLPLGNQHQSRLIRTKTPLGKQNKINITSKQQKKIMSRSTDHFSNIQKMYLNHINSSFDHCAINTSPIETEPHDLMVNLNNTTGCDNKIKGRSVYDLNLNHSNQRNKFLQTEVDIFNNTLTKSKVERRHQMNKSTSKGKQQKHTFSTSIDTFTKQTDSFNYTNTTTTNPNQPIKGKGSEYLARKIIDFIHNMKDLQDSICKKDKDVVMKKKAFEKYKKELVQLATDYHDKNTVSSFVKEDSIDEKESEQQQTLLISQLRKDNEKLIIDIEMKKTEIVKLQESLAHVNKLNETRKNSISMAKLKEFENIIKSMKEQIEVLKEEKKKQESTIDELRKENKDFKNQTKSSYESNEIISSLLAKFNSIYKMLILESQAKQLLFIEKNINQEELNKCDMMYSEILKCISTLLIEQKNNKQQGSTPTPSTVTPIKTPTQSHLIIEENKRLKVLFEECMTTIYNSIKEYAPDMFEEDDDMSFNYASGLNTPVNLLSSNNSKAQESITSTIDKETVKTAIEMFKKYNKQINEALKLSQKEQEILKMRNDGYKQALDDALRNNPNPNEKEYSINFNNSTKTFTLQDLSIQPEAHKDHNNKLDNYSNEAMSIALISKENDKLKYQIKLLNEELKIKTEALINDKTSLAITNDQENAYKTLYLKGEKRIKELEEQYETLVKEVINGDPEDSNNINDDHKQNNLNNGNFDLMQMINSQNFSNDNHHLNKNFDSKMVYK